MPVDWSQGFSKCVAIFEIDCARRVRRAPGRTEVALLGDSIAAATRRPMDG